MGWILEPLLLLAGLREQPVVWALRKQAWRQAHRVWILDFWLEGLPCADEPPLSLGFPPV